MKRYKILRDILLDFLTPQDQYSCRIDSSYTLECDEHTIWIVDESGQRQESITTANAVDMYLERGCIEELPEHKTNGRN
jgi:hypothetical protein